MKGSWTDQRIARMKNLWEQGWSASEIAAELGGVTRNGIIGKVHRLGVKRNEHTPPARKPKAAPSPSPRAPRVAEPRPDLGVEIDAVCDTKPDTSPFACSIAELEPGMCRFVLGAVTNAEYCGAPTARGSWCPAHYRRVYWSSARR